MVPAKMNAAAGASNGFTNDSPERSPSYLSPGAGISGAGVLWHGSHRIAILDLIT